MSSEDQRTPGSLPSPAWTRDVRARATAARRRISVLRSAWVALVRRYLPSEAQHLFALTLVVGVLCGLVAVAFHLSIRALEHLLIDQALAASGPTWIAWTIVTPTLGGLAAGAADQSISSSCSRSARAASGSGAASVTGVTSVGADLLRDRRQPAASVPISPTPPPSSRTRRAA